MTAYTVRLGLSIYLMFILMDTSCRGQQYPSWYPVNPCHVGCVNCLGCNNVLILNNSSFGGQHGGFPQPSAVTAIGAVATTAPPPPTTTTAPTTRPTRKVTVTTTWYIYPQWCPYCQRQYGHNKKCLPLYWLNQ